MSQAHFLTLYARTAEEVVKARDVLRDNFPDSFFNYDHHPDLNGDLQVERRGNIERVWYANDFPVPCYALTLMFKDAGRKQFDKAQKDSENMFNVLQEDRSGPRVFMCMDDKRAVGWRGAFAARIVVGCTA